MSHHLSIAAVIVTFNRLEKLKISLHAIQKQAVTTIVVVNNNSNDGTAEWLSAQKDKRLEIINLPENTGGAGGFSTGIKFVVDNCDADWLLCFDDDAYPQANAIQQFERHYSNTDADIVAAAVHSISGTVLEMNRPVRSMPTSFFAMLSYFINRDKFIVRNNDYESQVPLEIDACSFVGMFINCTSASEKFGYPRSDLFLYCDDLIYTYGIRQSGARLVFEPSVCFKHDCDNQPGRLYKHPWKVYYLMRNYTEFYRLVNSKQFFLMSIARAVYIISNIKLCNQKSSYLLNVFYGMRDGIRRDFSREPIIRPR